METIDRLLREVPIFRGMSDDFLALVAGCGKNVSFGADEVLFREGDQADTFYVVRHGRVAIEAFVPARGSLTIETIEPGEVVGWSWLFPPYRWQFDARTVAPLRATAFDGACLRGKCEADPVLGYALMSRFSQVIVDRMQWTRLRLLDLYGHGSPV